MTKRIHNSGTANAVYGLGFIGAAVFFISQSASLWMGVWGFVKALVWPALMVYELFKYMAA